MSNLCRGPQKHPFPNRIIILITNTWEGFIWFDLNNIIQHNSLDFKVIQLIQYKINSWYTKQETIFYGKTFQVFIKNIGMLWNYKKEVETDI